MVFFARLTHFLIPQESNNYRAKVIHNESLGILSASFLALQVVLASVLIITPKVLGYAAQISPGRVLELTNQERQKAGVPPLTLNSQLNESAVRKAGDMFAFNYWAHVSPSGKEPWAFFREAGYNFVYAGENLARDFSSPEAAMAAWMASPTHKENIVSSRYKEIGIAVVDGTLGGVETTLIVQHFGSRSGASTTAQKPILPKAIAKEEPKASVPTAVPTKVPTEAVAAPIVKEPTPLPQIKTGAIIARATGRETPLLNPFNFTQVVEILSLGTLVVLFLTDALVVWKQRTLRLTGRPLAHVLFLFGMLILILLSQRGSII